MKNYSKPQMMAKNAPTGSYAAGCPANRGGSGSVEQSWLVVCRKCERTA